MARDLPDAPSRIEDLHDVDCCFVGFTYLPETGVFTSQASKTLAASVRAYFPSPVKEELIEEEEEREASPGRPVASTPFFKRVLPALTASRLGSSPAPSSPLNAQRTSLEASARPPFQTPARKSSVSFLGDSRGPLESGAVPSSPYPFPIASSVAKPAHLRNGLSALKRADLDRARSATPGGLSMGSTSRCSGGSNARRNISESQAWEGLLHAVRQSAKKAHQGKTWNPSPRPSRLVQANTSSSRISSGQARPDSSRLAPTIVQPASPASPPAASRGGRGRAPEPDSPSCVVQALRSRRSSQLITSASSAELRKRNSSQILQRGSRTTSLIAPTLQPSSFEAASTLAAGNERMLGAGMPRSTSATSISSTASDVSDYGEAISSKPTEFALPPLNLEAMSTHRVEEEDELPSVTSGFNVNKGLPDLPAEAPYARRSAVMGRGRRQQPSRDRPLPVARQVRDLTPSEESSGPATPQSADESYDGYNPFVFAAQYDRDAPKTATGGFSQGVPSRPGSSSSVLSGTNATTTVPVQMRIPSRMSSSSMLSASGLMATGNLTAGRTMTRHKTASFADLGARVEQQPPALGQRPSTMGRARSSSNALLLHTAAASETLDSSSLGRRRPPLSAVPSLGSLFDHHQRSSSSASSTVGSGPSSNGSGGRLSQMAQEHARATGLQRRGSSELLQDFREGRGLPTRPSLCKAVSTSAVTGLDSSGGLFLDPSSRPGAGLVMEPALMETFGEEGFDAFGSPAGLRIGQPLPGQQERARPGLRREASGTSIRALRTTSSRSSMRLSTFEVGSEDASVRRSQPSTLAPAAGSRMLSALDAAKQQHEARRVAAGSTRAVGGRADSPPLPDTLTADAPPPGIGKRTWMRHRSSNAALASAVSAQPATAGPIAPRLRAVRSRSALALSLQTEQLASRSTPLGERNGNGSVASVTSSNDSSSSTPLTSFQKRNSAVQVSLDRCADRAGELRRTVAQQWQ